MQALIKSPYKAALLACCCLLSAETLLASPARAGTTPVTLPTSSSTGLGDTFVEPGEGGSVDPISTVPTGTLVYSGILDALNQIAATGEVGTIDAQSLPLSPEQFDGILLAVSRDTPTTALRDLEQQLANETGLTIELTQVDNSVGSLQAAIADLDQLLNALDASQLEAVADSPTFMTLREILEGANEALLREDKSLPLEEGNDFELLRMTLVEEVVIEADPTPAVTRPVAPVTSPSVGEPVNNQPSEPIRGLW